MSTPQNPARRRKQKARRTKQLAAWREKNAAKPKAPTHGRATSGKPHAKETKAAKKA